MAAFITAAPPPPASASIQLLRSHPLVAYFAIAFAGTWLLMLPIVLAQNGLGLLPFTFPDILLAVLFILGTFMGPTLAAFLIAAATSGRGGVRRLLQRYIQWRVGASWYLLVLTGPIVMIVVGLSAWLGLAPLATAAQQWPLIFSVYLPKALALAVFPALAEEPGWRGVALPQLQNRFGPVLSGSILGSLHALWHLPIFFITAFAT
ncbi:MAG: type II CAAX prenyl endopeptidase Rce1 family protein, partial [Roseiflexaceae bacterium]